MAILLWITLPFALAVAGCYVVAVRTGGWEGLGWVVYGAIAVGLWALCVVVFFIWLMARDGWLVWHGVPLGILVVMVVAALAWGGKTWLEQARESADAAFYERLAATPFAGREAFLEKDPKRPRDMTYAGREIVALRFVADRYAPLPPDSAEEAERVATLALLLEHGMPPDDYFFYNAVDSADPAFVRLLIERRLALGRGWEPIPPRSVEQALGGIDPDPASPYHEPYDRYLAMLRVFLDLGFDPCQPMDGLSTFHEEMVRKGLPADLTDAAGC